MGDVARPSGASAAERLQALLGGNDTGRYITPSRHQYVHQWLWDSCFHAIALSPHDPDRARRELASLLDEQREDGMIPHIRFGEVGDQTYRPNAEDWGTGRSSSGITQPPLVAVAARVLHERAPDRDFLGRLYPAIARYHAWMQAARDPRGSGLVTVVHPWESGCDNSPVYDAIRDAFLAAGLGVNPPARVDTERAAAAERPRADDYQFYWGLVVAFRDLGWSQVEMARRSPCRVADVTVNSVWARANEDLAALARELGRDEDARRFEAWAERTARALVSTCWSPEAGQFLAFDQARGERVEVRTSSGFLPLLTAAPSPAIAEALVEALRDPRQFCAPAGVPSTALDEPAFEPRNYWRGPVWIQMHWLIADGLRRHGYDQVADELARKSMALVNAQGYREYYEPQTGEGLGGLEFSWSALAHDLERISRGGTEP
jgi:glycogen debranching enzyme